MQELTQIRSKLPVVCGSNPLLSKKTTIERLYPDLYPEFSKKPETQCWRGLPQIFR